MNCKRQDSQWPFDVNVMLNLSIVAPLWLLMRRFRQSFCLFSPCSVSLYKRYLKLLYFIHFEITCYHNNLIMALSSVIYSPIALFFALNHVCSKSHLLTLNRNISVSYEITCFKKASPIPLFNKPVFLVNIVFMKLSLSPTITGVLNVTLHM